MPGIIGVVWTPDESPEMRSELFRRLCVRLKGPHDRLECVETAECSIAVAGLEGHPVRIDAASDVITAYEGISSLDRRVDGVGPLPFESLRPPAALAIWNARNRVLRLITDRYGFSPLCWAIRGGRFMFSSSAFALMGDPGSQNRLDDQALSDLLCFGQLLEQRTLIEDISLVPPATVLTWKSNRKTVDAYWKPDYREDEGGPSGTTAVRMMGDRLRRAILDCSEEGVGVLLSGGLDSRVLAAAASSRHRIKAITFGEPDTEDVKIADRVARSLGVEHHTFRIGPDQLPGRAESIVQKTDGAFNLHHAFAVGTYDKIRNQTRIALSGMQMLGSFVSLRTKLAGRRSVLPYMVPSLSRGVRRTLLTDDFFQLTERYIPESLNGLDALCPFRSPVNRLDVLDISQRQRRFILMGLVTLRDRVEIKLPLFDRDLMDFIRDVKPSLRADQRLYVRAFCHLFPKLARIPWAKTGLPVATGPGRLFLSRLLGRLRSHPPQPSLARTKTWHQRSHALCNFERDLLLGVDARQRGLFRPSAVERLLSDQEQGHGDQWDLIGRMVTMELWCRALRVT